MVPSMNDLYDQQFEGLRHVHGLLTEQVSSLSQLTSLEPLVARAKEAGGFLLGHHHMEDTILFPGLRTKGRGAERFLDARDREHHVLHALTERLLGEANAPHPRASELQRLGSELHVKLLEHLRQEEVDLSPEHLRHIIGLTAFAEVVAQIDAARAAAQVRFALPTR
jgi:hypothetical protein